MQISPPCPPPKFRLARLRTKHTAATTPRLPEDCTERFTVAGSHLAIGQHTETWLSEYFPRGVANRAYLTIYAAPISAAT